MKKQTIIILSLLGVLGCQQPKEDIIVETDDGTEETSSEMSESADELGDFLQECICDCETNQHVVCTEEEYNECDSFCLPV